MKSSIRKFLLINLLLTITVTTTLTAVGNYYLDQRDIQEHLDTLMAVSALSYDALLGEDLPHRPLEKIQNALNEIPIKLKAEYKSNFLNDEPPQNYMNKFDFQVWDQQGRLLLHALDPLEITSPPKQEGFSDLVINNELWRVFTVSNDRAKTKTSLAEHYDTRNELGHNIAQDDAYIMLLTFPLSGLLIWIIIGRGLDSLSRVAKEVSNRAPSNLEPVNLEEVPEEIKPVIDELNKLFHRLHEGFEREKRFAADAAHELRTPLAAIKAQAQVALNSQSKEEKNHAIEKLINNVDRSAHIVQQLLTMSRLVPEAAIIKNNDRVDLLKITREELALLAPSALEKQIELELKHDGHISKMHGNATALGILIRNLVDNAIRYSDEKSEVIVRLIQQKNSILLEVEDNGPGIPNKLRDRVFERFYRVVGNKSTGSGLGLAIVRQVTDLHNGKIELSKPKKGSGLIIRIIFPLQPETIKKS